MATDRNNPNSQTPHNQFDGFTGSFKKSQILPSASAGGDSLSTLQTVVGNHLISKMKGMGL